MVWKGKLTHWGHGPMNHNTLKQAIGESGKCGAAAAESLLKSIGVPGIGRNEEDMGIKPSGGKVHYHQGDKGPAVSPLQGGSRPYKAPKVVAGSVKSSGPGHGEGRGSPHKGGGRR